MIRRNTGKEVIQKYMSSNHSEVAAAWPLEPANSLGFRFSCQTA